MLEINRLQMHIVLGNRFPVIAIGMNGSENEHSYGNS